MQPEGHCAPLWADGALRRMRSLCRKSHSAREGEEVREGQKDLSFELNFRCFAYIDQHTESAAFGATSHPVPIYLRKRIHKDFILKM